MMQSFFLHNSFSIIQVMGDDKSWNRPQKDCNAINSWLFMAIRSDLYSKMTKVSDMEDSFENDAVILFA